jgi:hypothetical protein
VAVAVDASTPAFWTKLIGISDTMVSASFTAPANALLVATACCDGGSDTTWGTLFVFTDSGGLTWTERVRRSWSETTTGGASIIATARTTSSVSRTVTFNRGTTGASTQRTHCKLYVLTGVDVDGTPIDTVTANNEGGSGTNNLTTTSITAGANGLLICADCDWNELGVFTSSDLTIDTADYTGKISVMSGYKSVTSGASVNGNLNAGGTGTAQHKWTQIIVRELASKSPNPYHRSQRFFKRAS